MRRVLLIADALAAVAPVPVHSGVTTGLAYYVCHSVFCQILGHEPLRQEALIERHARGTKASMRARQGLERTAFWVCIPSPSMTAGR